MMGVENMNVLIKDDTVDPFDFFRPVKDYAKAGLFVNHLKCRQKILMMDEDRIERCSVEQKKGGEGFTLSALEFPIQPLS